MTKIISSLLALGFVSSTSFAQALYDYNPPEILARASVQSTYNLPALTFLNSTSVALNNAGDISFRIMALEGKPQQALWFKSAQSENGKVVYVAPEHNYVSDPLLNNKGVVTFSLFNDAFSEGVLTYTSSENQTKMILDRSQHAFNSQSFAKVLDSGRLIFRGTNKSDDRGYYSYDNHLEKIAEEGLVNFDIPSSYLFRPLVNNNTQWVFKLRDGEHRDWGDHRSDKLILLNPKNGNVNNLEKTIIAQDTKGDPTSPYIGFDNTPALSESGKIAFIAKMADQKKALILHDDGQHIVIAKEGQDDVTEFEQFSLKINSSGVVAFRAKNRKGLRGIYIASTEGVRRLLGEGDMIPSDLGWQYILTRNGFPGLAGDVEINDRGDISFSAVLSSLQGQHLGDAVYILRAK